MQQALENVKNKPDESNIHWEVLEQKEPSTEITMPAVNSK